MYRLGCNIPGTVFWGGGKIARTNKYDELKKAHDYLLKCGFDYVETPLGNVMAMSENDVGKAADELTLRAVNGFLPKKLYSNYKELVSYAEKAFKRMNKLGIETAVFGSGKYRKITFEFMRKKRMAILTDYLRTIGDFAYENGVTITIEPLNRKETNVFNTVGETCEFVRELNHPAVVSLADIYHMGLVGEDLSVIEKEKDFIKHIHVSEKNRAMPGQPGKGEESYLKDFFNIINALPYDNKISVEADLKDLGKQGPMSFATLNAFRK